MVCASTGAGLALAFASGPLMAQGLDPIWTLPSDGSWQPETVSLGAGGSEVFSEYGFFDNRKILLSSYDSNPPTPVWADEEDLWNHVRRVDSSARGTVHVALHQEYVDETMTWRRPVLRKYSSGSTQSDWVFESDVLISSHDDTHVFVSEDGSRIVTSIYDVAGAVTVFDVFEPHSSTPVMTHAIDTVGPCDGVAMSSDGRRMVTRSSYTFKVIDLDTGGVVFNTYYFGSAFHGGLDISGDGQVIATVSGGLLHSYHWNGSSYSGPDVLSLAGGTYTPAVAVSEDGTTVAIATNFFANPGRARIRTFEAQGLTSELDHLLTFGGTFANTASAIELSEDGCVVAVGLWGDEAGACPEVVILDREIGGVSATCDLPGSVIDLDLSPNGRHVAVAAKGAHASQFGSGGGLYLFEASESDFRMHGVPKSGGSVVFSQPLGEGGVGRVMGSLAVASEPRLINGMGYLRLDESSMFFLQGTATAGPDGIAWTQTPVTSDPQFIGVTVHLQGLGLRPRTLSQDLVQMTILP